MHVRLTEILRLASISNVLILLIMHKGPHPHENQPIRRAGPPLNDARAAMVMIHGRGASADDILALSNEFERDDITFLAPQAAGYTWYPYSFMMPMERNEPGLSSGLKRIGELTSEIFEAGIPRDRIFLLGFSQGACLALEYAARNAGKYAGIFGLSGGLIGPDGTSREYSDSFDNSPVFLGCSDIDSHIPVARVDETADVFVSMGAAVTKSIYPGMGHTINEEEIEVVRSSLSNVVGRSGDRGP